MISGPVVPRSYEGLWELVRSDPERLECGLVLLEEGLVIDQDLRIDALARDAAHGPVFLFATLGDEGRSLPGRIMEARDWLMRNQDLLRQALPDQGLRLDREPRCMVVGFDFDEAFLRRLGAMDVGDISAFRFETLAIGDQVHIGVNQLLGSKKRIGDLQAIPDGPSGVARNLGMQFVDLIKRIEPDCEVQGDRYSRSFFAEHGLLARLQVEGGRFRAISPCGANRLLGSSADQGELADAVLRYHVAMLDSIAMLEEAAVRASAAEAGMPRLLDSEAEDQAATVGEELAAAASSGVPGAASGTQTGDSESAVGELHEGLRRRLSKLKVSQEELEALGGIDGGEDA
ncbi:MAG: hypothetical protein ACYTG5_02945 [Planctomycetota bacterium]|jgi:hypothetical protein